MSWDRAKGPLGKGREADDEQVQGQQGFFGGQLGLMRMAAAGRVHRQRIMRKKADGAEKAGGAQVSQQHEAAEVEADAVADHAVDALHEGADALHEGADKGEDAKKETAKPEDIEAHEAKEGSDKGAGGGGEKAGDDGAGVKQVAPVIGAKLQPGAISLAKKGAAAAPPAKSDPSKVAQQQKSQKEKEKNPGPAQQFPVPHSPLSPEERAKLEEKKEARTITKEELERLDWDRRFGNRRDRGVDRFWSEERKLLKAGKPGTRNWTPEQKADILAGKVPKGPDGQPMEGHHKHNALSYPAHAADPKNVTAVTKGEHKDKWHGGNFQNETHGQPLKPDRKDDF